MRNDRFSPLFAGFIAEFGEPTRREAVPETSVARYRGRLPERLLALWQTDGWCAYAEGLFWTVNPERYQPTVDAWLADTRFEGIDTYHALARSAFGHLYLWGERHRRALTIACPTHALIGVESQLRSTATDADVALGLFFSGRRRQTTDITDVSGKGLFAQALLALGPLAPEQVYGFDPPLSAGGLRRAANLRVMDLFEHLALLRAMDGPRVPFAGAAPGTLLSR